MSDARDEDISFARRLMVAAREEGCRRVRVGDVEVEMSVVKNPLAEKRELDLDAEREKKKNEIRPPRDPYLDAMGSAVPVLRKKESP